MLITLYKNFERNAKILHFLSIKSQKGSSIFKKKEMHFLLLEDRGKMCLQVENRLLFSSSYKRWISDRNTLVHWNSIVHALKKCSTYSIICYTFLELIIQFMEWAIIFRYQLSYFYICTNRKVKSLMFPFLREIVNRQKNLTFFFLKFFFIVVLKAISYKSDLANP